MKISKDYLELKKNIATYIDKYPPATKETNKIRLQRLAELKPLINSDNKASREYYKIRDEIAITNGGFAMTYVMKYSSVMNENIPISELFQEATIGLIETIDVYDLTKNTSFTTYAFYHIRKRLVDYIKKNKLIKAPRDIARNIKHVSETQEYLLSRLGKEPNASEIKDSLELRKGIEITEETINRVLILLELNSAGYEDSFVSEYVDQISHEDHESNLFRAFELNILSSIQRYTTTQQRVIKLRFGVAEEYPHTVEEIKLMLNLDDKELKKI